MGQIIKWWSLSLAQSEDKNTQNATDVMHNQEQVKQCSQKRESDTISQEDVDDSNHEPTTEEQKEICQKLKEYLLNTNCLVVLQHCT